MNDRSNYLDQMIAQWNEESQESYKKERHHIEDNINAYRASVKKAERFDKIAYPLIALYYLAIIIFKSQSWTAVPFYSLPLIAVLIIGYLQYKTNRATNELDCSLSVKEFFSYRDKINDKNLKMWKLARPILYPSLSIYLLADFYFTKTQSFWVNTFSFLLSTLAIAIIVCFTEANYKKLILDRERSQY